MCYKTKICALSWSVTKIILRCTVSKTKIFCLFPWTLAPSLLFLSECGCLQAKVYDGYFVQYDVIRELGLLYNDLMMECVYLSKRKQIVYLRKTEKTHNL